MLGIVASPSALVVSNVIATEVLSGLNVDEVVLLYDGEIPLQLVNVVNTVASFLGIKVGVYRVGGDLGSWFEVVGDVGVDVVDVTAGRKIHALALLTGASEVGIPVRYTYLVDENRFGYRYFGYAPPYAIKLLEISGTNVREIRLKIPGISADDVDWIRVRSEVLHALINVLRIENDLMFIEACGNKLKFNVAHEPELIESVPKTYYHTLRQLCGENDVMWCLESATEPPNWDEVVLRIKECIKEGCSIAFDTNVYMRGYVTQLVNEIHGLRDEIIMLNTVVAELSRFLELKQSPEGIKKMLGHINALRLGLTAAPTRPSGIGDQAILRELRRIKSERKCVCFVTMDNRLALATKGLTRRTIYIKTPDKIRIIKEENIPKLIQYLTAHGELQITIGNESIKIRSLKPYEQEPEAPQMYVKVREHKGLLKWIKQIVDSQLQIMKV